MSMEQTRIKRVNIKNLRTVLSILVTGLYKEQSIRKLRC